MDYLRLFANGICIILGALLTWMLLSPPQKKQNSCCADLDHALDRLAWAVKCTILGTILGVTMVLTHFGPRVFACCLVLAGALLLASCAAAAARRVFGLIQSDRGRLLAARRGRLASDELEELPGVRRLDPGSEQAALAVASVERECASAPQFPFKLEVVSVFEVNSPALNGQFAHMRSQLHAKSPNVRQLCHGTSLDSMKSIVCSGFKLPASGGMFGRGIYFAAAPQKSWQYSKSKGSQFLLLSDVALGNSKRMIAGKQVDPKSDLRERFWRRIFGARAFDSVTGLSHQEGGKLRTPEYVVYNPSQALPRLIVECRETRR